VGPEADKYRLSVSGYSGDAGDALAATFYAGAFANGMQFSTPDEDNDTNPGAHCFPMIGWWLNQCSRSMLNFDTNGEWNAFTAPYLTDVTDARMMVKLD